MGVLKEILKLPISDKTIPLIEIVQEFSRTNSKQDYAENILNIIKETNKKIFIDIVRNYPIKSTTQPVRDFLLKVNRIPNFAVEQLKRFKDLSNITPVVSYNTKEINESLIEAEVSQLRECFQSLAFRINSISFNNIFPFISNFISDRDFLLLDIGSASHTNPALKIQYRQIKDLKRSKNVITFILNDPRSSEIANKNLVDDQPILEIDNSLLEMYSIASYGFDGFGDYAGITSDLPSSGGTISPAGIYYSRDNNFFVGYRGRKPELSEFDYIAKKITESGFWKEFDDEHHTRCPGCSTIQSIVKGEESGRNQAKWKGITMLHYIFTVDQSL